VFRRITHVLLIASLPAACVKTLPPAPTPEPVAPALPAATAPLAAGQGRLVVDVVEGPTPVQRIRMTPQPINDGKRTRYRFEETPETLCMRSPCATDVAPGNVLLAFPVVGRDATEVELVHVGAETSVYRRSLSIYTDDTGGLRVFGIVATAVGGTAAFTGTCLLPIGLAKDYDGLTTAGAISLGGGALLLAIGIWAMNHDAPTFRPGSSHHFPLR
jgi:hypothetical protein